MTSNPSSMSKRLLVALFAVLGAILATRLLVYQLGWSGPPFEPFFGDGTIRVVDSSFSRSLPIPDASLGVVGYVVEALLALWGGSSRFVRSKRTVYVYAGAAVAMALGSLGLLFVQAFVLHEFCTLCLASAAISFVIVVPSASEGLAALRAPKA